MDKQNNLDPNLVLMAAEEGGRQVMALQAEVARLKERVAELEKKNLQYRIDFGAPPPLIGFDGREDN